MNISRAAIALSMVSIFMCSCLKQNNGTPPDTSHVDPNLPVNVSAATLSQLALTLPAADGGFRRLGDSIMQGIVVADDRSGNFYKQIVINDSTGGMTVVIAQTDIYNDYPIGRKVYIKLNGMVLVNYHGLPEIAFSASFTTGALAVVGVPPALESTYIIGATYPNVVTPITVSVTDLFGNPNKYLNRLVTVNNMEFDSTIVGKPYAPSATSGSYSSTLPANVCSTTDNGTIPIYNSAYATFQAALAPNGKGSLTGIYSVYNTPQFLIRDTTDIQFTAPRTCQ